MMVRFDMTGDDVSLVHVETGDDLLRRLPVQSIAVEVDHKLLPRITLTLEVMDLSGVTGRPDFRMRLGDGDPRPVKRVEFADGTTWEAPEA